MPAFRVTFFINQFNQGWTETYFAVVPDIYAATTQADTLLPALMGPKQIDSTCVGYRVSQVDPPGNRISATRTRNVTGGRGIPILGVGANPEDLASTAAMMQATFNDGSSKTYLVRGLADDDVTRDMNSGRPIPAPALNTALNDFGNALAKGWSGMRQDQTGKFPRVQCTKVGASIPAGQTVITGPQQLFAPVGTIVHFTGVPRVALPWLKGKWSVVNADLVSITIQYAYPALNTTIPTNMFVQQVSHLFPAFTGWGFADFRSRQTGRPFGLTRGRSPGIPFRRSIHAVGS